LAKVKFTIASVLAVLVIILVLQNTEPVETRFLFASVTMPRAALLALTMLLGVATGVLVSLAISARFPKERSPNQTRHPKKP